MYTYVKITRQWKRDKKTPLQKHVYVHWVKMQLLQFMCFPQISPVVRVFKDFSRVDVEYCYTQVVNFTIVDVIGSLSFVEA